METAQYITEMFFFSHSESVFNFHIKKLRNRTTAKKCKCFVIFKGKKQTFLSTFKF